MRYLHSMIRVSDLQESLKFFCEILGLIKVKEIENNEAQFTYIVLSAPEDLPSVREGNYPMIELIYNWDQKELKGGRAFGHLAFQVPNLYEYCEHLRKNKITLVRPPRDGHMAFIKSPDGISIELIQEGAHLPLMEPWVSMENQGEW